MRKYAVLILLLIMLTTSSLSAQNYLFQEGQSGIHLKAVYSDSRIGFNEYNAELGYTINGRFTFGVDYWQWKIPTIEINSKIHFGGAKVDYLLIRQNKFPMSISAGISYKYSRNIGEIELWEPGETIIDTVKLHEINLNTTVSRRFNLNTNIAIVPSVSLLGTQRFINNSSGAMPGQTNTLLRILLQTDIVFHILDVFGGADLFIYPGSTSYWYYKLGIGILLKT